MTANPARRDQIRRQAQGAIDAERRAAVGPFTFNKARPVLAPREVIALLDALDRAEARIKAVEDVLDGHGKPTDRIGGLPDAIRRALDGDS